MKLSEAVIKQNDEKKSYLNSVLEFDIDDRIWVRPLKQTGSVVELPNSKRENYLIKLDDGNIVEVNWYNLFLEEERVKYDFHPTQNKKEEINVVT